MLQFVRWDGKTHKAIEEESLSLESMKFILKGVDQSGDVAYAIREPRGRIEWNRDRALAAEFSLREASEIIRKSRRTLSDWRFSREEVVP